MDATRGVSPLVVSLVRPSLMVNTGCRSNGGADPQGEYHMLRMQFVGAHRFAHEWGPFLTSISSKAAFTHSRVQVAWIEV